MTEILNSDSPGMHKSNRRKFLVTIFQASAATALATLIPGCKEQEKETVLSKRMNDKDSVFFYKTRYESAWGQARKLELQRKMLVRELAESSLSGTLRSEIEEFNYIVERSYNVDSFAMFGGERPENMSEELEFIPVPKIEKIALSDQKPSGE